MDQYFCDCGNVIINVVESRLIEASDFHCSEEISSADPFFSISGKLLDVKLGISGIETAQDTLLKERACGDWLIFKCINCCKDSHSVHSVKGTQRVLIPSDHMHGSDSLKTIQSSKTYSKVFNIDLQDFDRKENAPCLKPKKVSDISVKINNKATKYLKTEEEAMDERIRLFIDGQKTQFQDVKIKTGQQKEKLLKKIRQYENNQMESLFDSFNESYFGNTTKSEERDLSTDLPQIKGLAVRSIPTKQGLNSNLNNYSPIAQSLPSNINSPNKIMKSRKRGNITFASRQRAYSESDDTMFDLEDFQGNKNCEPFYESDDDSGDTTSLESSGGGYTIPSSRGLNPGDRVYATSVPVSIPLFENTKNSYDLESDEEQNSPSPSHIADSIKALAKSMQDSTSMFGELPRPRLNTFK